MDPEEKELFKKLLDKIEKLEKKVENQGRELQRRERVVPRQPEQRPIPKTGDRLTDIILRKNRQRALEGKRYQRSRQAEIRRDDPRVDEIRENFSLYEIIKFVKDKKIPIGNQEKEEEGSPEAVIIRE